MPSQRADAAHIAPYLTHLISHHGQLTLVPPDNNGRRRKAKPSRNAPREEPVRFNSGPTDPSFSGRLSRRMRRASRTDEQCSNNSVLDEIPDYPPPSFQEAISSPPLSVCPSTTTLGQFTTTQSLRHAYNSDSDSESDDGSDIVDPGILPRSRGPTTERSSLQSQPTPRGRGILDADPDDPGSAPSSSNPRAHRRHLSLSPLRTLFPRNARESGHALSAQSTPSSHSLAFSRSSPFFRSSTSLRNLTSATPFPPPSPSSPPSIQSESLLTSRRFFSHKGKERATSEALDSWEIVESALPATPVTPPPPQHASPVQEAPVDNIPPRSPASMASAPTHPLSERDRQVKSKNRAPPIVPNPVRERERRAPPPPPPAAPTAPIVPGAGPPIVTVRMKKPPPPPPPKKKPQAVSSPLAAADRTCTLQELDLDRAVQTPLPLTPVTGSPTSLFAFSAESPTKERVERVEEMYSIPSPPPRSSSGTSEHGNTIVDAEAQHPNHHYPGRPLPRRPRVVVDSTYAPHPDFPQPVLLHQQPPSVPEGLLIDLDDAETPTMQALQTDPFASVSADLNQSRSATEMQRASSASSVDLAPAAPPADFMDITDLDILLAQLENDQRGANYDALLMLSGFIGNVGDPSAPPWQSAVKTSALSTGHIEVQRRRTTKDGRVKLKLALLGIAVDRCGICMTQFKKAERARLSEGCKHAFHDRCLARWVVRSRTCPLCRIVLDLEAGDAFR